MKFIYIGIYLLNLYIKPNNYIKTDNNDTNQ